VVDIERPPCRCTAMDLIQNRIASDPFLNHPGIPRENLSRPLQMGHASSQKPAQKPIRFRDNRNSLCISSTRCRSRSGPQRQIGILNVVIRCDEKAGLRTGCAPKVSTCSRVRWKHGDSGSVGKKRVQQKPKRIHLTPNGLLMEGVNTHRAGPRKNAHSQVSVRKQF